MDATPSATDLTQSQLLAHIAHLSSVGTLPNLSEVRFAADRDQVHLTAETLDEGVRWGEWVGAEPQEPTTETAHWVALDWHGWVVSIWAPRTPHRPEMTPRNLARALLES